MWFIGVEVEQEASAPLPKKNAGSAPEILDFGLAEGVPGKAQNILSRQGLV